MISLQDYRNLFKYDIHVAFVLWITCEGAAIMPTANPHTILPSSSNACCVAVPMSTQPKMSGSVDTCSVRRHPMASITGPEIIEPRGVAAECILAKKQLLLFIDLLLNRNFVK